MINDTKEAPREIFVSLPEAFELGEILEAPDDVRYVRADTVESGEAAGDVPAAIYQLKLASGDWRDQDETAYRYNAKHCPRDVRVVYMAPLDKPAEQTAQPIGWEYYEEGQLLKTYDSAANAEHAKKMFGGVVRPIYPEAVKTAQACAHEFEPYYEGVVICGKCKATANEKTAQVGCKLVPVEPTEAMIIDGFESCPHPLFSEPTEWGAYEAMSGCQQAAHRARLCYAAMLAAAPAPRSNEQTAPNSSDGREAANGLPATHQHDEGAIARCSYCGRYSLDPKTLSNRQPKCDCGKQHGWSGSFEKPGCDAQWSGGAPLDKPAEQTAQDGAVGWKLAMRVLQSPMYAELDDAEKAECDALIKANPYAGTAALEYATKK